MRKQNHLDRDNAFDLTLEWLGDVCEHVEAWKFANPSDSIREPLYSLLKRIFESCKGAFTLTKDEQYEQAGALLRMAIENLWLVDLFGSDHPRAAETLKDWIDGKKIQPYRLRQMLAEEFADGDHQEANGHRLFLDEVYSELCSFIHPRATSPSVSLLEPCLVVVLTSVLGCLPSCLSMFQIAIPGELIRKGNLLMAEVPLLLITHQPDELQHIVMDFAASIIEITTEQDFDKE